MDWLLRAAGRLLDGPSRVVVVKTYYLDFVQPIGFY